MKCEQKRIYTVGEIQSILGICKSSAYNLLKTKEFSYVKIGSAYRISKISFDEWLERKQGGDENGETNEY